MPETVRLDDLGAIEKRVFGLVVEFWPMSALDVALHFNEDLGSRDARKKASTKYSYYLQKLLDKKVVLGKRVGNALVVWPVVVEKYRTIHNILRE